VNCRKEDIAQRVEEVAGREVCVLRRVQLCADSHGSEVVNIEVELGEKSEY
jgi:hypothetical protein